MKLFAAAFLVVFVAGAVLAVPQEAAAPAEQAAAPVEAPKEPATPEVQTKPAEKPTKPSSVIGGLIERIKDFIGKVRQTLRQHIAPRTKAAGSLSDRKKATIAKIDKVVAELRQKEKAVVVPSSPKDKRDNALALKAAINLAIRELTEMKNEILKLN